MAIPESDETISYYTVFNITCLIITHRVSDIYQRINKVFKMGGHDSQSIPKLVGHLLHLQGYATESRSLAISSLCLYNWEYMC